MSEIKKKWVSEYFGNWRFQYQVYDEDTTYNGIDIIKGRIPHGGLAIRNVYHDNYRFAYDMRTHAIWVFPGAQAKEEGYSAKKLVLGIVDFEQIPVRDDSYHPVKYKKGHKNAQGTVNPDQGKKFGLPYNFSSFANHTQGELMVKWKTREKIFGEKSDYLFITQIMVFTGYASSPAHEPSGGISAARIHPLTRLSYSDRLDGYFGSIRIDYRFHINLDSYSVRTHYNDVGDQKNGGYDLYSRHTEKGILNNQAGLFRDRDEVKMTLGAENVVFEASEKPLVAEVIGTGLIDGSNLTEEKTHTWDNIHWWGSGGNAYQSAPGAFHAFHMHWRWSRAMMRKDPMLQAAGVSHTGNRQFVGLSNGGVLTDPDIQNQSIQVAVAIKREVEQYADESTEDFESYFGDSPRIMDTNPNGGANIVLYYAVEVNAIRKFSAPNKELEELAKKLNEPIIGFVFLHGIFFPHEVDGSNSPLVGTRSTHYANPDEETLKNQINNKKIKWKRNPTI